MHIPPAAFLRVNPAGAAAAGLGRPRPWIRDRNHSAGDGVGQPGGQERGKAARGAPPASERALPAALRGWTGGGVANHHLRLPTARVPAPAAPGRLGTPAASPQPLWGAGRARELLPSHHHPAGQSSNWGCGGPVRRPTDLPARPFVCELAAGPASGGSGDLVAAGALALRTRGMCPEKGSFAAATVP